MKKLRQEPIFSAVRQLHTVVVQVQLQQPEVDDAESSRGLTSPTMPRSHTQPCERLKVKVKVS